VSEYGAPPDSSGAPQGRREGGRSAEALGGSGATPPSSLVLDSAALAWRPTPFPGVRWKKLFFQPESGRSAVLLSFAPGSTYAAHRHPGIEQYLVLEGSLEDGARTYAAGTWVHHPAGSVHRPSSRAGCLLYVTLDRPIELLDRNG